MELQQAKLTYNCINIVCKANYGYNVNVVGATFNEAMKLIDVCVECHSCKMKTMELSHVVLIKMKDDFGDPKFGMWQCPVHSGHTFYPALLQKAFAKKYSVNNLYERIAQAGLPLKCPYCASPLNYIDERTLACAY